MQTQENHTRLKYLPVANLAIEYPASIHVFKKYNIDFCCGGKKTFEEVCNKMGLNSDSVLNELDALQDKPIEEHLRFTYWSIPFLIDYIIENHHSYVKNEIPEILRLLAKTVAAHGENDIELVTIHEKFNLLSEELLNHLEKEEKELFPWIKELIRNVDLNPLSHEPYGKLRLFEIEHEGAADIIKSIRFLSNNYTPPAHSCPTYIITYKKLKAFDEDLMTHIHLENNVLFNKVNDIIHQQV